jgi:hypothetical protein
MRRKAQSPALLQNGIYDEESSQRRERDVFGSWERRIR